ncbi:MAG TPA: hypothetical protein VNI01_08945, partial [Elusimicrobiota bacterium]|nr:hypothetical protein [Elusimicrobiota bacterium]
MHTSTLLSLALIRASLASPVLAANAAPVRSAAAGAPMSWGAYFAASPGVLGALAPEPQQAGALARLMDQPGIAPDGVQAFLERRDPDSQAQAALIEPLIQPMIDKALEKAREPQPDAHAAETAAATLRDVLTIADVPGAKLSDDSKARIRKDVEALRESAQAAAHLERLASARAPSFDGGVTHRA